MCALENHAAASSPNDFSNDDFFVDKGEIFRIVFDIHAVSIDSDIVFDEY